MICKAIAGETMCFLFLCNDAVEIHTVPFRRRHLQTQRFEEKKQTTCRFLSYSLTFFLVLPCAFRDLRLRGASCAEVNWCSARLHVKPTLIGTWKPWTLLDTEVQREGDWELLRGPGARLEARDWRRGPALLTWSQQGGEELFSSSGCACSRARAVGWGMGGQPSPSGCSARMQPRLFFQGCVV